MSDQKIFFHQICTLLSKIHAAPSKLKVGYLSKFLSNWRDLESKTEGLNFFPVMRLLLPQLDRQREAYGIKEFTLAKMYIRILSLPPTGRDAMQLTDFRAPKSAGNQAGDFAQVAYFILKRRCGTGNELTLDAINAALDQMAHKHADRDQRGVESELGKLLQATSAEEQKWLIRIILKDMKLGIAQGQILDAFHPDARDLFDVTNSLSEICVTLKDPNVRLNEIEIKLFVPFRPMLSEELNIRTVDNLFNQSRLYFVETKMDGERFQIHMQNGKFKYFSRRAHDYTSNYGADTLDGMLTPDIAKQISSDVSSVILDGEMMCWNERKQAFTTKGADIDVKKLNIGHVHRPCFCTFDVLYLNGEVLTNKPLINRLEILEKVITPKQGVISFVARTRVSSKSEVFDALNKAIDDYEEGLIMKEILSVYKPNVRNKGGWYKIKPEYTEGLMDTLDLLIIGGYHGEGRFGGTISHFLLGVSANGVFWSVARVGCGYSAKELGELQRKLQPFWHECSEGVLPAGVEWTKEKPDVWIEPQNSVILEVKASEIVKSDLYRTNYTLRFGRVEKVRYDKQWSDCLTLSDFEQKRQNASGKLTTSHLTDADLVPVPAKIRKVTPTVKLGEQFKAIDTSNVEVVSQLLSGKEVCVMSGWDEMKREAIEKRIVRFGGKVVKNPGLNTWCVLSEEENIRVKNLAKAGLHNVVRCSWLMPHLSRETEQLPDLPRHAYLCLSLRTAALLSENYDEFGDHFTAPATEELLRLSLETAGKMDLATITLDEKAELDSELFSGVNPYRLFRRLIAYVPSVDGLPAAEKFNLRLAMFDFIFHGGHQIDDLDDNVTHVVYLNNPEVIESLKTLRRERERKFFIVSYNWVEACLSERRLIDPKLFPLR